MTTFSRRLAAIGLTAALAMSASAALAQKSQSQLDWEAQQASFLAQHAKTPGWKTSASGLQFHRVSKPNPKGQQPTKDSEVQAEYVGTTISDNEFDASPEGEPLTFGLSEVIPGWTEGVQLMREGETWEFAIPANLAYGDRNKAKIPPGSALLFKVKLVKVLSNPAAPPSPAAPAAKKAPAKKK